jgi:hypothetical protein
LLSLKPIGAARKKENRVAVGANWYRIAQRFLSIEIDAKDVYLIFIVSMTGMPDQALENT